MHERDLKGNFQIHRCQPAVPQFEFEDYSDRWSCGVLLALPLLAIAQIVSLTR